MIEIDPLIWKIYLTFIKCFPVERSRLFFLSSNVKWKVINLWKCRWKLFDSNVFAVIFNIVQGAWHSDLGVPKECCVVDKWPPYLLDLTFQKMLHLPTINGNVACDFLRTIWAECCRLIKKPGLFGLHCGHPK